MSAGIDLSNMDKMGTGSTRYIGETQASSPIGSLMMWLGNRLNGQSAANQKLYNGADSIAKPYGGNWSGLEYDPSGGVEPPAPRGPGGAGPPSGRVKGGGVSGGSGVNRPRGNGSSPGGRGSGSPGGSNPRGAPTSRTDLGYSGLNESSAQPKDAYQAWKSWNPKADPKVDAFMQKTMSGKPVGSMWGGNEEAQTSNVLGFLDQAGGDVDKAAATAQGILAKFEGQKNPDGTAADPFYMMNTMDHGRTLNSTLIDGQGSGWKPTVDPSKWREGSTAANDYAAQVAKFDNQAKSFVGNGANVAQSLATAGVPGGVPTAGGARPPVTRPPTTQPRSSGGRESALQGQYDTMETGGVNMMSVPGTERATQPGSGSRRGEVPPPDGSSPGGPGGPDVYTGVGDPSWQLKEPGMQYDLLGTLQGDQTGGQGADGIVGGYGKLYNSQGFDEGAKTALRQEMIGGARAQTAGLQNKMQRLAASSGNRAGLYSGLAGAAQGEQANVAKAINQNIIGNYAEKQRQNELGLGGMKDLYSMNQAEQQATLQALLGLVKTPRETTDSSSSFGWGANVGA